MFKRKNLQNSVRAGALAVATAMAGMGTAGLSTSASAAVSIANDGLGETMIFPYYTARNGFASFFNITNTSNKTVIIKVRWNEGENSRDARDFNVILSPYDMWTVATTGAANNNARAITADNSCTSPLLPVIGTNTSGNSITAIDFTNVAYTGSSKDTGTTDLSRTREGYFTVFEMGIVDESTDLGKNIARSAKHSAVGDNKGIPGADDTGTIGGVPATSTNCAFINNQFSKTGGLAALQATMLPPENVLKGRAVLIELSTGVAHGYDPTILANFSDVQILDIPGETTPNLNSGTLTNSYVDDTTGVPTSKTFSSGVHAITDLLARTSIINDYNITSGSQTDWVITFPTKGFYVDKKRGPGYNGSFYKLPTGPVDANGNATFGFGNAPFGFSEVFSDPDRNNDGRGDLTNSIGKSCVEIAPQIWDREEFEKPNAGTGFSPIPPGGKNPEICKEANILSFGNSNIFDSHLRSALFENNITGLPGLNGWAKVSFAKPSNLTLPGAATATIGLPVTGMRLEARQNSKFAGKSFGFASDHAYQR